METLEFFRVVDVQGIDTLMRFWKFLEEGLESMNKIAANNQLSKDEFFQLCAELALAKDVKGKIFIVLDKNTSEPLSYTVSVDNSNDRVRRKSLLILGIYSNRKSHGATRYGLNHHAKWAKDNGYHELHGYSSRITGAAVRLFENIFGFKKHSLFMVRKI
jgi:hypothetical protein